MSLKTAHDLDEKWRSEDIVLEENVDFSALMLSDRVLNGLKKAGFKKPSPIQLQAIPLGRFGLDLVVQAKSGTGKTCVFTVIALENLLDVSTTQVVILTPTREIATQICDVVKSIGCCFKSLKCCPFIGGLSLADDQKKANGCHIAVGTPGRVRQLIGLNVLRIESVRLFVIDEADKMLEEVFSGDLNWIFSSLPENKQVLAVSATFSKKLAKQISSYMRNPLFVRLNIDEVALLGVFQYYCVTKFHPVITINYKNKYDILWKIVNTVKFSQCLIFCNMITRVESLCNDLNAAGFPTTSMSSAQDQEERLEAIEKLKTFKSRILVTSDLVARGIDAENVDFVINFDLPYEVETYLHRIGRAGRYGSRGISIALVPENELCYLLKFCEKTKLNLYSLPDPLPSNLSDLEPDNSQLLPQMSNKVAAPFHSNDNSNKKKSSENDSNHSNIIKTSKPNEALSLNSVAAESIEHDCLNEEESNNNHENTYTSEISHSGNNHAILHKVDCEDEHSEASELILDHNYCKRYVEKTDDCSSNGNHVNGFNKSQEKFSPPGKQKTIFENAAKYSLLNSEHNNDNHVQLEPVNLECEPICKTAVAELLNENAVLAHTFQDIQFVKTESDPNHELSIIVTKNGMIEKEESDSADNANIHIESEKTENFGKADLLVESEKIHNAGKAEIQVENEENENAEEADTLVKNSVQGISNLGSIETSLCNENLSNTSSLLQPFNESSNVNDASETFVQSVMNYYSDKCGHETSSVDHENFELKDDYKQFVHNIFPVSDHKNLSYGELNRDFNEFVNHSSVDIPSFLGTSKVEPNHGDEMTEIIENILKKRTIFYSRLCVTLENMEKVEKDDNSCDSHSKEKFDIDNEELIIEKEKLDINEELAIDNEKLDISNGKLDIDVVELEVIIDTKAVVRSNAISKDLTLCEEKTVENSSTPSGINSDCESSELENKRRSFPLNVGSRLKTFQSNSSTETTSENVYVDNSKYRASASTTDDNTLPSSSKQSDPESGESEGVMSSAENYHYSLLGSAKITDSIGNDVDDFYELTPNEKRNDDEDRLCAVPSYGSHEKYENMKSKKKPCKKPRGRNNIEITTSKVRTSKTSKKLNDGHFPSMKWVPVIEKKAHSGKDRSNIGKSFSEDVKIHKGLTKDSKDSHCNRPTEMFSCGPHYNRNPIDSSYYQYPYYNPSGISMKNNLFSNYTHSLPHNSSYCNCFQRKSPCCSNTICSNRRCSNVCNTACCKRSFPCHNVNSCCDMSLDFYVYYNSYLQNMLRFPH